MTDEFDIQAIITDRLRQVNTSLPGRVESYDANSRRANVLPLIDEKYADGQKLRLPVITGVPVVMPSTGSSGLSLPIGVGDGVLLLFCQRSIDNWASVGGEVEAGDARMHALSDAIAIAGLFDFTVSHSDGAGLRLYNGNAALRLTTSKVALGTSTVELLDEITKALDDAVAGFVGAAPSYPATDIVAASAAIKSIKGSI